MGKPESAMNKKAHMNRTFRRILNLLDMYPNSIPFARPVDTSLLPDYPSIVKKPVDLLTMINKTNSNSYTSVEDFVNDLNLIKSNCILYCQKKYPDIVKQVYYRLLLFDLI